MILMVTKAILKRNYAIAKLKFKNPSWMNQNFANSYFLTMTSLRNDWVYGFSFDLRYKIAIYQLVVLSIYFIRKLFDLFLISLRVAGYFYQVFLHIYLFSFSSQHLICLIIELLLYNVYSLNLLIQFPASLFSISLKKVIFLIYFFHHHLPLHSYYLLKHSLCFSLVLRFDSLI